MTTISEAESAFTHHQPCTYCGSSDACAVYDDGHTYCFACNTRNNNVTVDNVIQFKETKTMTNSTNRVHQAIPERALSTATVKFFDVGVQNDQHIYPYFDNDGVEIAHKYRTVSTKTFKADGNLKSSQLFGQHLFSAGGRYVTITEGELDALSVYQMTGSKYPVVSIKTGAQGALKDCKQHYEWLDSFEHIIISFDSDQPGKMASQQVAELFGTKAKIVTLSKHKDASDYLSAGDTKLFIEQWWAAERYIPDGILAGSTLWDEVNRPIERAQVLYPWQGLNDLTYGIRKSELITVTAGSGLGKSQVLREIVHHILMDTKDNIGLMFLEESVSKTARSIMSIQANIPLHLPQESGSEVPESVLRDAFEKTLGTDRLYLFDHFGSTNIDNIVNRVKYMAKALDCSYIFLDHLSIIVSSQENGDERKAIDEVMTRLRMLVQETGISLILVSHLRRPEGKGHEEGASTSLAQLRGSASIAQLSDIVIGLERSAQAEDMTERNTTKVRVLKNRFSGLTGECCRLLYTHNTGRLSEIMYDEAL